MIQTYSQYEFFQNARFDDNGSLIVTVTDGSYTSVIQYFASNYTDLITNVALTPIAGELAYVIAEQGTKWLPGSLGGTYYSSGLYYFNGTIWTNDNISINDALNTLASFTDTYVQSASLGLDNILTLQKNNLTNVTVDLSPLSSNVNAANVGTIGSGIFKDKTSNTLNFRNIVNAGGIGVVINNTDNTIELTNQNTKIVDMRDTFFDTLVTNDLIQWDGTSWINVQPTTLPINTATQTALNLKQDKPLITLATTTSNATTPLISIPIPLNTNKSIRYHLKGRSSTTGNRFGAECWFEVDNTGGTVILISTPTIDRKSSFTNAVQTSVTVGGSSATINITGPNGQTVNWELYVKEIL